MPILAELARFVTEAEASTLAEADRAAQRRHVLDALVAAPAGARTAEGRHLAAFFERRGPAEIVGQRAAAMRLSEIDDIHLPSCTTPSAAAVAVALSLAGAPCDPGRVASAIWVGTELMTRLGCAVRGPEILYRGIWPSYLAAPLSAAAAAARMRGLDVDATGDALSLALMLTTGGVGRLHASPSARWVLFALAVAVGISAVDAVASGYRGDPGLLDGDWFEETHGIALDRVRLTCRLADFYSTLTLKPFCSAKQSIAAAEALRRMLDSGIKPDAIASVRVRVPPAYAGMIGIKAQAGARSSTLVSVARQLALMAYDRDRLYDIDRTSPVADPAVLAFEAKVEVVADPELAAFYPERWPAEVEIVAAGAVVRERVIDAPGDPGQRLTDAEIEEKAHRVLDPLLGREPAADLIAIGWRGFENESTCRTLVDSFLRCFAVTG